MGILDGMLDSTDQTPPDAPPADTTNAETPPADTGNADAGGLTSTLSQYTQDWLGALAGVAKTGAFALTNPNSADPAAFARSGTTPPWMGGDTSAAKEPSFFDDWKSKLDGVGAEVKQNKELYSIVGSGAAALMLSQISKQNQAVARAHYQAEDALAQQRQQNAQTSTAGVNVNTLGPGLINTNVAGGYNARRKRNMAATPGVPQ